MTNLSPEDREKFLERAFFGAAKGYSLQDEYLSRVTQTAESSHSETPKTPLRTAIEIALENNFPAAPAEATPISAPPSGPADSVVDVWEEGYNPDGTA